jgi:hypothetical protein
MSDVNDFTPAIQSDDAMEELEAQRKRDEFECEAAHVEAYNAHLDAIDAQRPLPVDVRRIVPVAAKLVAYNLRVMDAVIGAMRKGGAA